jgi:hypothetical protein
MEQREQGLWLRGPVLLILAPGVLTILVYVAAGWIDPTVSERLRALTSVAIGFGTGMCFTGIFLLGIRRVRLGELERADRIWFFVHALSTVAMGLGAVVIGASLFAGGAGPFGPIGLILVGGGFAVRIGSRLVSSIAAGARRSGSRVI